MFVEEFFKAAEQGVNLKQAFEAASSKVESYTQLNGTLDPEATFFGDRSGQHPLLEDNNEFDQMDSVIVRNSHNLDDPSGSNPEPDGLKAASQYIGVAPALSFNPSTTGVVAEVVEVTETVFLGEDAAENTALLFLKANSDSLVQDAFMVVRKLGIAIPPATGGSTSATRQVDNDVPAAGGAPAAVKIPLARQPGLGYLAQLDIFGNASDGPFRVFYYVQDSVHVLPCLRAHPEAPRGSLRFS